MSWWLHNIIAWMKMRPFLSRFWSKVFLYTVILSSPYWVLEIYASMSCTFSQQMLSNSSRFYIFQRQQ
jgi:hypothetical protein